MSQINTTMTRFDYAAFLENLHPGLVRQACRIVAQTWSCRLEVDDLMQESLLALWQYRDRVQAADDPLPFALKVSRNTMLRVMEHGIHPVPVISLDTPVIHADGSTSSREIAADTVSHLSPENTVARERLLKLARQHLSDRERLALFLSFAVTPPKQRPVCWHGTPTAMRLAKDRAMCKLRKLCQ